MKRHMALKTYAAIEVGSKELVLKVYEIGKKIGIRQLDHVRYMLDIGSSAYSEGTIGYEQVNELCDVLKKFKLKLEEYQVDDYVAYGGSALKEADNGSLVLDQIKVRTGLRVRQIGNAQQRFLVFKSIAFKMQNFEQLIKEGAVIIDLGSGSLQVSVFEDGALQFSQNIRIGALRIREMLSSLEGQTSDFTSVIMEFVDNNVQAFRGADLKAMKIKHAIVVGEEFSAIMNYLNKDGVHANLSLEQFNRIYDKLLGQSTESIAEKLGLPYELASVLVPAVIVYRKILDRTTAKNIWEATSDLCDGMALDYSQKVERYLLAHDFSKDIIKNVRNIAKRYASDEYHVKCVESMAKSLFDGTKKISGLNSRYRLLLQVAAILHDSGKYINSDNSNYNASHIIRESELIGLSDVEKEIVASIVLYNSSAYVPDYEDMSRQIDREQYIAMLKLTSLFSLANAMDRSHKQKIKKIRVVINETEMRIIADTIYDITLEQGMVESKARFFEEIFGIRPVLRQKRNLL